ncbi:MAG: MopE-related protein, partial [Myxococcota bacterium]|nr:MopE-related protein [Myxococcota bacterium]
MLYRLKPLTFILAAIIGCGNSSRPVGEVCGSDTDCSAQLCVGGICLDPDADADGDGITNRIERLLGTGVLDSDSDSDGVPDGTELGDPQTPSDTDGDGVLDCLESDDADSDGDCLPDQYDAAYGGPAPIQLLTEQYCSKVGVCATDGIQRQAICESGVPSCRIEGPGYELVETSCDGLDNDCDGRVDEALRWQGLSLGSQCVSTGQCARSGQIGIVQCHDGQAVCSTAPGGAETIASPEVCNGLDDDCDGLIDEDLANDRGQLGEVCQGAGICPAGVLECRDGGIVCSTLSKGTQYVGSDETCNGLDDDCDGLVDEDFLFSGLAVGSTCGKGKCLGGIVECNVEGTAATCSSNLISGEQEQCNGIDDDCDGETDESSDLVLADAGCPSWGVCSEPGAVVVSCKSDGWHCEQGPSGVWQPDGEVLCDGLDNDCDGQTDEEFGYTSPSTGDEAVVGAPCGIGQCSGGVVQCTSAGDAAICTTANQAMLEICDGLDNDCDGLTDEGQGLGELSLGAVCPSSGECGPGIVTCNPDLGIATCSTGPLGIASKAVSEVCNGLDDDCDGETDEWDDVVSTTTMCAGPGICAQGGGIPIACSDGVLQCDLSVISGVELPSEVSCNGTDDDCDGATDEGLKTVPGGGIQTWFDGVPTARLGVAVSGLSDMAWAYGGTLVDSPDVMLNDLWVLQTGNGDWTRLNGSGPTVTNATLTALSPTELLLVGGQSNAGTSYESVVRLSVSSTEFVATNVEAGGQFADRTGHVAVYNPEASWLWVFGGEPEGTGQATSALDLSDPQYPTWVAGVPEAPGWRSGPAAAWVPGMETGSAGQMVVFSGESDSGWDATTWVLDIAAGGWIPLEISGPSPRHGASMVWHEGQVWLYGGISAVDTELNDVWTFDPTTYTWVSVESYAPPGPRSYHQLWSSGDELALIGGLSGGALATSAWIGNVPSAAWTPVSLQATPPARRDAKLFSANADTLLLVGGTGLAGEQLTDVWQATVTSNETLWKSLGMELPILPGSAVTFATEESQLLIHGGVGGDGADKATLWSWSPMSGPSIASTNLPVASQHALAWDGTNTRLLGYHAGLLWRWDKAEDSFGALPTTGEEPGNVVGHTLHLDGATQTLYLLSTQADGIWAISLETGAWVKLASALGLVGGEPSWVVGGHLVLGTSVGLVKYGVGDQLNQPLSVSNTVLLNAHSAPAYHPALGRLFSLGGVIEI